MKTLENIDNNNQTYYFSNSQKTILDRAPEIKTLLENSQFHITTIDFRGSFISHMSTHNCIDNIKPDEMDSSVAVSVDPWNRIYISFRIAWKDHLHQLEGKDVYTFFQKNSKQPYWLMGTTGKDILQIHDSPFIESNNSNSSNNTNSFVWKSHVYKCLRDLIVVGKYSYHNVDLRLV